MHPNPSAETFKPLQPSSRICMMSPALYDHEADSLVDARKLPTAALKFVWQSLRGAGPAREARGKPEFWVLRWSKRRRSSPLRFPHREELSSAMIHPAWKSATLPRSADRTAKPAHLQARPGRTPPGAPQTPGCFSVQLGRIRRARTPAPPPAAELFQQKCGLTHPTPALSRARVRSDRIR